MTSLTRNTDLLRVEVAKHIAADAVIQGRYWDGERGCFIGCLSHSPDPTLAVERFGLTLPLLRIAESIFERLPADQAKAFFAALPDAVGCDGKDLSRVHWQFLAAELRALPDVPASVQAAIDPVIDGIDRLARGEEWNRPAADAAYAAAYAATDAARAAAYAADAAARAARAADAAAYSATDAARAARAARAAACAADAAADAATDAARAACAARAAARAAYSATDAARAARAAAYAALRRQRDTLLPLISNAPIKA
jgi:hypothetical protein